MAAPPHYHPIFQIAYAAAPAAPAQPMILTSSPPGISALELAERDVETLFAIDLDKLPADF